jgi:hypothetical protein
MRINIRRETCACNNVINATRAVAVYAFEWFLKADLGIYYNDVK